jgi:hypothetical protein
VVQQLREAFPDAGPYRYAILDHDAKFDADVIAFLKATGYTQRFAQVQAGIAPDGVDIPIANHHSNYPALCTPRIEVVNPLLC